MENCTFSLATEKEATDVALDAETGLWKQDLQPDAGGETFRG
jgi:hypothetical protein